MAADGEANKDFRAHQGTYSAFIGLMKWGAIASIIVAMIVILVIRT